MSFFLLSMWKNQLGVKKYNFILIFWLIHFISFIAQCFRKDFRHLEAVCYSDKTYNSMYSRWNTSNDRLSEGKKQKPISTNAITRHHVIAIAQDQQSGRSSFSLIQTCLQCFNKKKNPRIELPIKGINLTKLYHISTMVQI